MSRTRAEQAKAVDEWADRVDASGLKHADTEALREIAVLAKRRVEVDEDLTAAIRSARRAHRSWSEIGAMLGVSKQAAHRKYAPRISI